MFLTDNERLTRSAYSRIAADWDEESRPRFRGWEWREFTSFLRPGSRVLDLGCGTSREIGFFHDEGYEYVGIDFCFEMLRAGQRREVESKQPTPVLAQMNMRVLGFRDEVFDAFWSPTSFMHLGQEGLLEMLSELRRVLKPSAVGMFSIPANNFEGIHRPEEGVEVYCKCWYPHEIASILTSNGFSIVGQVEVEGMLVAVIQKC